LFSFFSFTSRKHKRYYYTNETQQSQWDFPVEELKEREQLPAAAPVVSMATTIPGSMTQVTLTMATPMIQTWTNAAALIPVDNSTVQVPIMPIAMTTVSLASTLPVIGN
jgi:hypothetical protein